VLATSKRTQTIAARYDYDAWGNEINNTGTSDNPLGYTGHQMDRDIGLIYANARYLDPDTGRFLSFDPFEGYDDKPISLNKYLYAYQNPLVYTDPTGQVPILDETGEFLTNTAGSLIDQAATTDSAFSAIAFGVGAGANIVVGGIVETVNFGLNIVAADGWLGSGVKKRASNELNEAFATIQTIVENPKGTAVAIANNVVDVAEGVVNGEHKAYAQAAATITSLATGKPNTSVSTAARSVTQTTANAARVSAQLAQKVTSGVKEFAQTLVDSAMSPSRGQLFGQRGAIGNIGAGVAKTSETQFRVAKHGDMPSPRPGQQSHHGVMSAWMKKHFSGYDANKAPAVLMPEANHRATFGVYNTWRAEMRKNMSGTFDWSKVSERQMRSLSENMFDAADIPLNTRQQYWKWYDQMKGALTK
ncbi:MAG: hypothetical protein LRY66_13385, partial [Saccharospirillaceae bacterium]|nr:hypothetical protein [Saccharospirillaceae bacterium]